MKSAGPLLNEIKEILDERQLKLEAVLGQNETDTCVHMFMDITTV